MRTFSRHRARAVRCAALLAGVAALAGASGPTASAAMHTGGANCTAQLEREVASYSGSCFAPFQGFPVGVAGVFNADDPAKQSKLDAEIAVELWVLLANGTKKPLLVDCTSQDPGVARCFAEKNPISEPSTSPEPAPSEIVGLECDAESRSVGPASATPTSYIACWSTNEARQDLEADHWFSTHGFGPYSPPPPSGGGIDPFRTLSGAGVRSQILAVPVDQYAPTPVVVSRRLGLNYTNLDLNRHDVVARDDLRPDGSAPWCSDYPSGTCPLFWTPLLEGGGTMAPVQGLEDAKPGDYTFYCSIHPSMVGTITVAD